MVFSIIERVPNYGTVFAKGYEYESKQGIPLFRE